MIKLEIKHTKNYSGSITVDGQQVKTLSQAFDEKGFMSGAPGEFIINRELYYANIVECRKQEDAFKTEMRRIEDERVANENEITK